MRAHSQRSEHRVVSIERLFKAVTALQSSKRGKRDERDED